MSTKEYKVDLLAPVVDNGTEDGSANASELRRWVWGCSVDDLDEDEGFVLPTTPPVSIFTSNEEFFCIDDICTHETASLADGWVDNCTVECPLHTAKFDLRTGNPLTPPACLPLKVHPTRIEDGKVQVQLPVRYLQGSGAV